MYDAQPDERPHACVLCGAEFRTDPAAHGQERLKAVQLFKHLGDCHGLTGDCRYNLVMDQIYPEEAKQRAGVVA